MHRRSRLLSLAILPLLAALAGCGSIRPEPMSFQENADRARADRQKIDAAYVPLNGPLSLAEAIARALKYNYDAQLAKTEITLQERQLNLAMSQMLPRLAASAGYDGRNSYNAAQSIDVITQQQSLVYSYSQEPQYTSADLLLTWNALDLGISYFQAKQQGYRTLIAVERRRKVIDNVVRSTANAYWRAASAATLLPRIEPMLKTARQMMIVSQRIGAEHLQSPLALLDFQQNMIIVLSELERIRNELAAAHIELATLINVPQGTQFVFTTLPANFRAQADLDNHRLEEIGLTLRPELRIEAYQQKIERQDIYKEIVKMMPGIGILGGLNYNSNALLYTNAWSAIGVRATYNLFSLVQGPLAIKAARQAVDLSEQRRIAVSVAILSQINLAVQEYGNALDSYKTALDVDRVGQQIGRVADDVTTAGAQAESDRIRRQLTVLTARVARDRAQVRVLTALASLYAATGLDLVPAGAELKDLPALSAEVEQSIVRWRAGQLPVMPAMPAPPPTASAASVEKQG